ncbi:MAG: DUF1304 family protein [Saprospiraceae bacterium]
MKISSSMDSFLNADYTDRRSAFFLFIMESFLWKSLGRKSFGKGRNIDFFNDTASLAFNQVYNLFLCAGLFLSLILREDQCEYIKKFFSDLHCNCRDCGWSVSRRIFIVQAPGIDSAYIVGII